MSVSVALLLYLSDDNYNYYSCTGPINITKTDGRNPERDGN